MTPAELRLAATLPIHGQELEELAMEVLRRELGLERFMVVCVETDGRTNSAFQIEKISLLHHREGLVWLLEGPKLRRDGRVSQSGGGHYHGVAVSTSLIQRRRLDGQWQQLRRRPV